MLSSNQFNWPLSTFTFDSIDGVSREGTVEVREIDGQWMLDTPGGFSYTSGQSGVRLITASLDGTPTLIRGTVLPVANTMVLRVDELRIGSANDAARFSEVTATFEHLASASAHRIEDRAARSTAVHLLLPEIDNAPAMKAALRAGENSITLMAPAVVPLEDFESQLAVFQAMLTFAADLPCGRLTLEATDETGQKVSVLGREKYAPFECSVRNPVEYSLRFSGDWFQRTIDLWWEAYRVWKPVLQIIAGLRYQPGYVDADVILSSAAIEAVATSLQAHAAPRLSAEEARPILEALDSLSGLNTQQKSMVSQIKGDLGRTTFRSKLEQLTGQIDPADWGQARVSVQEWTKEFINARNTIAHAKPSDIWDNDALLRGLRDANWIALTLVVLKYLEVPSGAIARAAERLGTRYGIRHGSLAFFS